MCQTTNLGHSQVPLGDGRGRKFVNERARAIYIHRALSPEVGCGMAAPYGSAWKVEDAKSTKTTHSVAEREGTNKCSQRTGAGKPADRIVVVVEVAAGHEAGKVGVEAADAVGFWKVPAAANVRGDGAVERVADHRGEDKVWMLKGHVAEGRPHRPLKVEPARVAAGLAQPVPTACRRAAARRLERDLVARPVALKQPIVLPRVRICQFGVGDTVCMCNNVT